MIRTKGFTPFMREMRRALRGEIFPLDVAPDAWLVAPQVAKVVAIEVEDTSRLSEEKIGRYCRIAESLADFGWRLHVVTYDRYGMPALEIDPEGFALCGPEVGAIPAVQGETHQLL
jgi:hypothetical protein